MQSFFVDALTQGRARLSDEDARHLLKSLRMAPGDHVALAVDGRRYEAQLQLEGTVLYAQALHELPGTEPRARITLYQALCKGDKMDSIVQKATEIGVHAVQPCLMSRCVSRWEGGEKKLSRWQRIAREAAVQSGRGIIPQVRDCLRFDQLCQALPQHQQALVPWEQGGLPLATAYQGAQDMALIIGPEGGISEGEIEQLKATAVTLGPRILRAETAGLVAAAMLLQLAGDMQ